MESARETMSVGQLAAENPSLMALFDKLGVDYCCGGDRSLVDACADSGLTVDEVLTAIQEVVASPSTIANDDWTNLDMLGLVDHIEQTHHRYLTEEMPRLAELAYKVVNVHGGNHPELAAIRGVLSSFIADMDPHLMKEERVLFPIVREIAVATEPTSFHCGSVANPIGMMRYEHEQVGEMLAEMRRLSNGYTPPDDACASFEALYEGLAALEADTHQHIHKENNVLFPSAVDREGELQEITLL